MKTTNTIFKNFATRLFLLVTALIMTGIGQIWGASWTWTVGADDPDWIGVTRESGQVTLNGKTWSFTRTNPNTCQITSSCLQLGKNGGAESVVLSTKAIGGLITQIDVNCSSYKANHTCKIEVGGTTVKNATATSSWTTTGIISTGTISNRGEIVITLAAGSGARAAYIKSITVTYTPENYNVDWVVGGSTTKSETSVSVGTPPSVADNALGGDCSSLKFLGWSETNIGSTPDDAPSDLFPSNDVPGLIGNKTFYAVFGEVANNTSDTALLQIHKYDSWSFGGTTYDKSSYRLFSSSTGYVESSAFDLSRLAKVIVFGGTCGGDSYNGLSIEDESGNVWKTGTVTGSSETGKNTFTGGTSLSGSKKLRVRSTCGTSSSNGIRMTKVQIFVFPKAYSNCVTTCGACTEEPITGDAAFEGIAAGTISVSCDAIVNDDGCATEEYGFVWKTGASAPSSTSDGTKVKVGDGSGGDSGFSADLSISFTTGNTYQIVPYATNAAGTTLGAAVAVTPRSVTFNSNGGSSVATQYVNNGGTVSAPSDPTKSGFVFGGWYTDNGTWASEVNFSSTITEDKTYYAKWLTYGDYKFSCAELTLTAHPETADAPIFITSVANKKVRSQGYITITGNGLTPSTALTFPGLNSKFEIKTASGGAISTDENGEIDDVDAYIFYTPGVGDTDDGLDKLAGITVSVGGGKPKTVSIEQSIIGRHLPTAGYVIAGKKDGKWYALPSNMASTSTPAPSEIAVDNTNNPTIAYTAASNIYGLEGPTTSGGGNNIASGYGQYVRLTMSINDGNEPAGPAPLFGSATGTAKIGKSDNAKATNNLSAGYWWQLKQTNTSITNPQDAKYIIYCANNTQTLSIKDNAGNPEWGLYASGVEELHLIPASDIVFTEAYFVEWGQHGGIIEVDKEGIGASKVKAILGEEESSLISLSQTQTSGDKASKYNYTVNFGDGIDFADAESNGAMLTLEWYNGSDVMVAVSNIVVPKIIASSATMSSIASGDAAWSSAEVHVLPGVTLTANAGDFESNDVMIKHLEIYPGATVVVTKGSQASGTLKVKTLVLRNGWKRIGGKAYDVARLYITPTTASLAKNAGDDVWYSEWYIDFDQYYPIAVPWPVTVANMSYKNSKTAVSVGPSGTMRLRYYDGNSRATNIQEGVGSGANWKQFGEAGNTAVPSTLDPSKGYAMTAKRPTGKAFSIIRMPMTIPSADWTTGGEKGEVSGTHKDQVSVGAYGVKPESKTVYAEGWNFIANPYMSLYQGTITLTPEEGDATTINVVNIPDVDFKEYGQYATATTKLKPASGFLVQVPKDGTITFGTANRKASAPSYRRDIREETEPEQQAYIVLHDEEAEDMMGIFVSDKYTAEYDLNGDVEKLLSSGTSLRTYMRYNDMNMAYVAIDKILAQELIPVSVRIPNDGEYTFSLHEASIVDNLKGIYLIDHYEGNRETNLLEEDYLFYSPAGTISDRFTINAIVGKRDTPTSIDITDAEKNSGAAVKFLYRDKMYILRNGIIYDATGKRVQINK